MAYTKTTWVNDATPAINATNLNKIETGVGDAHTFLNLPGWRSYPPFLDENSSNAANKPTLVTRGVVGGYSLPEYAAGEELLFRMRVPFRWDGITNPYFIALSSISAAEDIGDKYKFQLEWQSHDSQQVVPATIAETLTHEITVADGTAYYAELLSFEFDAAALTGQNLQGRLRRLAASSSSVSNEVIIWHWDTRWKINKVASTTALG